jgi:hypothetical protein
MRPAPLLVALSCLVAALSSAHAQDAPPARSGYFIDFRARPGALWGHTFIVYGSTDGREVHRAGIYPDDGQQGLIFGTFVPVPATVRTVRDDLTETPSAIYRRSLSAADYARLKSTVARLRASERLWQMLMYNCNDFAQDVAHTLGLATPPSILVPNAWVRALKAMNGG